MISIGQITELLRPWLEKANETIAITLQPAYTYLSQKRFDRRCFVRAISKGSTPDSKRLDYVEPLEDCNMVQGISAGGKNCNIFHVMPNIIQTMADLDFIF